jgi:hypothetical protein
MLRTLTLAVLLTAVSLPALALAQALVHAPRQPVAEGLDQLHQDDQHHHDGEHHLATADPLSPSQESSRSVIPMLRTLTLAVLLTAVSPPRQPVAEGLDQLHQDDQHHHDGEHHLGHEALVAEQAPAPRLTPFPRLKNLLGA